MASAFPDAVAGLALIGASPGIADQTERQNRIASDDALAVGIERDGIDAFVDRWERLPLFATQQRLPEETRVEIRRGRLGGRPLGLANSLRGMGAGAQPPLHGQLSALSMPVLLLAGEEDPKYMQLGREMARVIPNAEFVSVPGVGHAAHIEDPEACARIVVRFLKGDARP